MLNNLMGVITEKVEKDETALIQDLVYKIHGIAFRGQDVYGSVNMPQGNIQTGTLKVEPSDLTSMVSVPSVTCMASASCSASHAISSWQAPLPPLVLQAMNASSDFLEAKPMVSTSQSRWLRSPVGPISGMSRDNTSQVSERGSESNMNLVISLGSIMLIPGNSQQAQPEIGEDELWVQPWRLSESPQQTLASTWPSSMGILRLTPQHFMMNIDKQLVEKSDVLVFKPIQTDILYCMLREKKLVSCQNIACFKQ
ncbi:hypothetical protein AKJ16_DCAP26630 [Drosera capensis]